MRNQQDTSEIRKYIPSFELNQIPLKDIIRISNISIFSESICKLLYSGKDENISI